MLRMAAGGMASPMRERRVAKGIRVRARVFAARARLPWARGLPPFRLDFGFLLPFDLICSCGVLLDIVAVCSVVLLLASWCISAPDDS